MFRSILGLYPLMPVAPPPVVTTKTISRHCQMLPGVKNHPQLRTILCTIFSILHKPRKFIEIKKMYLKCYYTLAATIHASIFLCTQTVHSLFLYNFQKLSESSPHIFYSCITYLSTDSTPKPTAKKKGGGKGGCDHIFFTTLTSISCHKIMPTLTYPQTSHFSQLNRFR